jgi:hypothetical protein
LAGIVKSEKKWFRRRGLDVQFILAKKPRRKSRAFRDTDEGESALMRR